MSRWLGLIVLLFVVFLFSAGTFVVQETEQVILTQFGKPVGQPITAAGLHFKMPFVQEIHTIDKRALEWDGPSANMPTRDKLYIDVDAFGRWRISEPMQFFLRLHDERSAQSRLDDILGSEMRNTIARHDLVELIRTMKGRVPIEGSAAVATPATPGAAATPTTGGAPIPGTVLPSVQHGRLVLEAEVFKAAHEKLKEFGIELLDVRFKRINYNAAVASKIFERMMSERRQIAERFRSEGAGEAAKILGQRGRDLQQIESESYRKVQVIQGKADAEATAIYARAFNSTAEARDYFVFLRTLETYRTSFQRDTTAVFTTDSPLFKFLKGELPAPPKPANPAPAPNPIPPGIPSPPSP